MPSRTYATLSEIEDEAFLSRIWGGIHFRDAMDDAYLRTPGRRQTLRLSPSPKRDGRRRVGSGGTVRLNLGYPVRAT